MASTPNSRNVIFTIDNSPFHEVFGLAPSFDCVMRRGDQEAIILSSLGYRDGRKIPEHCKNIKTCRKETSSIRA